MTDSRMSPPTTYETVRLERSGAVAWIVLNRPQAMNSMGPQMVADVSAALDAVERDAGLRCLVLTGEGRDVVDVLPRGNGMPVGMLRDSEFATATCVIDPGSQILLYSDGAFDLTTLGGGVWSQQGFVELCIDLTAESGLSLDELVHHLQDLSRDGRLEDDCSLIELTFD